MNGLTRFRFSTVTNELARQKNVFANGMYGGKSETFCGVIKFDLGFNDIAAADASALLFEGSAFVHRTDTGDLFAFGAIA